MTAHSHPIEEPMRVSDVLDRAAALIEPEGAWIGGDGTHDGDDYARDANGYSVPSTSPEASSWCLYGSIRAAEPTDLGLRRMAEDILWDVLPDGPAIWNHSPDRTQAEVVAKLREAAALAQEQGK